MLSDLKIQSVEESRLGSVDFDNLGFGDVFSDHMFSMVYEEGRWYSPEILPFGPISLPPASADSSTTASRCSRDSRVSWASTGW